MLAFRDFPSHVRLMLLAARSRLRPDEIEQIQTLASDPALDWPGFLAVTPPHRVSPLVFESLDQLRPTTPPAFVHAELQSRARRNAFEAMRSTAEVRRIAESYAAAGL